MYDNSSEVAVRQAYMSHWNWRVELHPREWGKLLLGWIMMCFVVMFWALVLSVVFSLALSAGCAGL